MRRSLKENLRLNAAVEFDKGHFSDPRLQRGVKGELESEVGLNTERLVVYTFNVNMRINGPSNRTRGIRSTVPFFFSRA